jgi:hypothetical protein
MDDAFPPPHALDLRASPTSGADGPGLAVDDAEEGDLPGFPDLR